MENGNKCLVGGCQSIAVARDLCQKHYMRWKRHNDVFATRQADWGSREKHPLYSCWNALMRTHGRETVSTWHDLWAFVADVKERPSKHHRLLRQDETLPYGPQNFYWKNAQVIRSDPNYKEQAKAATRRWRAANPRRVLDQFMRKQYGIGIEDYERMLAAQDGHCAICRQEETRVDHRTKQVSRLAVDHDHKTGAVRELLCHGCNNGLGAMGDDLERLRAAIAYLERHSIS